MEGILLTKNILYINLSILVIILSVAGIFLIKLLIDLSKLATNIDEATTIMKNELEPTLTEFRQTLQKLNSIANTTNNQVENLRNILGKVASIPIMFFDQFRTISGGFVKGLSTGLKLFSKK